MDTATLDAILALQFKVAWAGEKPAHETRLGWWRTDVIDEMSGGDFMLRLAPRTHRWAALEAAREAARLCDQRARSQMKEPDRVFSLFHWGYATDELLADRLRERKLAQEELPEPKPFDRTAFEAELKAFPAASHSPLLAGRSIRGPQPEDPLERARMLAAALLPLGAEYPLPCFCDR